MAEHHELMGGKLHVYRRENSGNWQCSTYLAGKNWRVSTKEDSLSLAKDFAEDWYLGLKGKSRAGGLKTGKTFKYAAERFFDEFEVITQGQRSPIYVAGHKKRLENHLIPFFKDKVLSEITPGLVQDYRIHRMKTGRINKPRKAKDSGVDKPRKRKNSVVDKPAATGEAQVPKPPARSTLHQEIVCLRQVLKTANRHGWLEYVPNISPPYKTSGKITHRAWFSPDEYKKFYEATRARAKKPKKERWRTASENMHDYVLFMVNTGLRPDEALRLEFRDVAIVTDEATGERILEIEVRGKRGIGFCKSMPGAVMPFRRLKERNNGQPTDRLFPTFQRELFNTLLDELNLKVDRDGQRRTAYSLRHTYICLRLMEGADIYQVAKNCRTSVEMIENYYASHIKNTLDAAAINVRKPKPQKRKKGNEELEARS
jgi:integrase